jgi:hypothetical protein
VRLVDHAVGDLDRRSQPEVRPGRHDPLLERGCDRDQLER